MWYPDLRKYEELCDVWEQRPWPFYARNSILSGELFGVWEQCPIGLWYWETQVLEGLLDVWE